MTRDEPSIIQPRAVSGFPEWLPEEEAEFQRLLTIIRVGFETFGFAQIETPAAELMEVLASKGEINKQIYALYRPAGADEERLDPVPGAQGHANYSTLILQWHPRPLFLSQWAVRALQDRLGAPDGR